MGTPLGPYDVIMQILSLNVEVEGSMSATGLPRPAALCTMVLQGQDLQKQECNKRCSHEIATLLLWA